MNFCHLDFRQANLKEMVMETGCMSLAIVSGSVAVSAAQMDGGVCRFSLFPSCLALIVAFFVQFDELKNKALPH